MVKETSSYMLLRPFLEDVGDDDPLCGAFFGKQHQFPPKWHLPILEGLITIPKVDPGDTVWWHPGRFVCVNSFLKIGRYHPCSRKRAPWN